MLVKPLAFKNPLRELGHCGESCGSDDEPVPMPVPARATESGSSVSDEPVQSATVPQLRKPPRKQLRHAHASCEPHAG
jgi:hypothetical protein